MTDIDHPTEALKIIHEATHDEHGMVALDLFTPEETATYHASMVEAQVHATLAVAGQLRVANLIALHRHEVEYDIGGDRSYLYKPGTEDLRDDIKKGLGL